MEQPLEHGAPLAGAPLAAAAPWHSGSGGGGGGGGGGTTQQY
jgi:hypothetical protein